MSETDPTRDGRTRSRLPLSEDDLRPGGGGQEVNTVSLIEGLSYKKLFLTIVVAAPVAAVFAMMSTDIYSAIARKIGLRSEAQFIVQAPKDAGKEDERLKPSLDSIAKANKELAVALERQTAALNRFASKDSATVKSPKAEPAQAKETAKPEPKNEKPAHKAKLSVKEARERVEELSDVDLSEQGSSVKPFETMKSKEKLQEIADALDTIIAGAKSGGTLKKNAERAKKAVNSRLASLEKK